MFDECQVLSVWKCLNDVVMISVSANFSIDLLLQDLKSFNYIQMKSQGK